MTRFITPEYFIAEVGEREAMQIAGSGAWNSIEGNQVDASKIAKAIAYSDELIAGHVLARHGWLQGVAVGDIPNLLQGISVDIVRYRLRIEGGDKGQVSETVQKRYDDALKRLADIRDGKLELRRDRAGGADLPAMDAPGDAAHARLTGAPSEADQIIAGYQQ